MENRCEKPETAFDNVKTDSDGLNGPKNTSDTSTNKKIIIDTANLKNDTKKAVEVKIETISNNAVSMLENLFT